MKFPPVVFLLNHFHVQMGMQTMYNFWAYPEHPFKLQDPQASLKETDKTMMTDPGPGDSATESIIGTVTGTKQDCSRRLRLSQARISIGTVTCA